MAVIINQLIALPPHPRQKIFQTRWMALRGIDPASMLIVRDRFAVLAERIGR